MTRKEFEQKLRVKKSYFLLVLFFTLGFSVFAQNRQGLVIDNEVRLRKGPGINTEIAGKKIKIQL